MAFNECEAFHEVEITPDRLREVAAEMERKSRSDYFQQGQIIRMKINHRIALVFRPERPTREQDDKSIIEKNTNQYGIEPS